MAYACTTVPEMDTVLSTEYGSIGRAAPVDNVPGFLQTITTVLSYQECDEIIRIAEAHGFVAASIYTDATGREHFSETRKSSRCVIDSPEFARRLWTRIEKHIPFVWKGAKCVGLNERLRILRYDPGDEFKPHSDGAYMAPDGACSKLTVLLYLNAGYRGGFTHFMDRDGEWIAVEPHVGSMAVQDQSLLHGVPPLLEGRKYAIRTEVMYMPKMTVGPVKEIQIYE